MNAEIDFIIKKETVNTVNASLTNEIKTLENDVANYNEIHKSNIRKKDVVEPVSPIYSREMDRLQKVARDMKEEYDTDDSISNVDEMCLVESESESEESERLEEDKEKNIEVVSIVPFTNKVEMAKYIAFTVKQDIQKKDPLMNMSSSEVLKLNEVMKEKTDMMEAELSALKEKQATLEKSFKEENSLVKEAISLFEQAIVKNKKKISEMLIKEEEDAIAELRSLL